MFKHLQKLLLIAALLCVPWVTQAQTPGDLVSTFPYSCDFESQSDYGSWVTVNGTQENGWYIGSAVNATTGGTQSLYVSNDAGVHNTYGANTSAASYSWAYQRFTFAAGGYDISFKWRNYGEIDTDPYDFFRVFIVPDNVTLTAGTLPSTSYTWSNQFMSDVPAGWIGINNGNTTYYVGDSTFSEVNTQFSITTAGNYKLVFLWLNDDNTCNNPAASIDDIEIEVSSCPAPCNLTYVSQDASGVSVSWTPLGTETSWLVYLNGEYEGTATASTYTIANPSQGNNTIAVAALCGAGDTSSLCPPILVFVAADAISEFPYSTGFETGDDDGWEFVNDGTNKWFIGSATAHTGTNSLYISNNNGTSNAYTNSATQFSYAYRTFSVENSGDMAISFDWKAYGESNYDYLRAWIAPASAQLTAAHDPEGGTSSYSYTESTPAGWIDLGGKMNLQNAWQTQVSTFHVNPGTYNIVFMWANDGSGGSAPPAAVDNIILTELSCAQPQNLFADALQTSADLIWTPGGDETEWELSFESNSYLVTDTFYNATNLTANTPYTFAVRAICGAGDTSFWSTYSFRTPCNFIDSLPWVNSFEDASTGSSTSFDFGDPCWTLNTNATMYPYVYVSSTSSYAHTGGKGIYWYRSSSTGTYGTYQCLVLPGIDIDEIPLNTLQLKFWAKASSSSYNPVFEVGVMTDPANINTFTTVGTVNVGNSTVWQEYETFFSGYEGTGRYMAVRANYNGDYWYAYVDDFTIDVLPACPHVASISVDTVATDYIGISWIPAGEESEWIVLLNDSIIGNSSDTLFGITDLNLNTLYSIGVAALCDNGDTSEVVTVNGRTLAGAPISSFPYICGFEIDADNNIDEGVNWVTENMSNGWYVGTAASNGGTRGLYVSDNNGTTNSYSGSACVSYAYVSLQLDAGEYAYSYDWLCEGESSFDYLRVALAPFGTALPTSYSSWGTGASAPSGFTALDGGKLNLSSSWQTNTGEFSVTTPGTYNFIFVWRNDGSVYYTPAAAIDNFMITRNTCPKPINAHATLVTSDTVTIVWQPGGTETNWVVSDGTNSYEVQAPDTSYTFGPLNPNTNYHFTIQAICSDEDSSLYASVNARTACGIVTALPIFEDFESTGTTSSSNNNFIPCWTKVCNATSYYYPYVSNSTSYNHTPGGSIGLYWYRSSTQSSYGDYNIIVLPQLDTNALPINTTMLTFWAKPSSTSYAPVFHVGAMQHPDSVATFQTYQVINVEHTTTDWVKYTVIFDEFVDTVGCSYIAIRSNYDGSNWYAYVDDISLDSIPDCGAVEDLTVTASVTSAVLSWNTIGTSVTGAEVEYKEVGATSWSSLNVTGVNYAILSGLTPDTTYDVRVSTVCGDANASAVATQFETRMFPCHQYDANSLGDVTIGQGATTSTYFPSYSFYNYGYSQQFFTAHEMGGAGVISSITLYPQAIAQQRTYEIYMGTYADSSAASYVTPTGLTCVYNGGQIPLVADQPVTFNFTTPFNYDGTSNLVVIFRDLAGSYVSGNAWYGDNAWTNASMYSYQDGSAYVVPQTGSGTASTFRNKITFFGGTCLQPSTCAAPVPYASNVGVNTVDLVWSPGNVETSWNLYYRQVGASSYTSAGTVNTNSYQFTGLASGTNYEFMVVPVCTDSLSASIQITTECAEISTLPFFEDFNSWGAGSGVMPNCWYRTGSYSTYTYISASQNMTGTTGGSIYMYQSGSSHSTLFLPALDTTVLHANQTQLVFYAKNTSASYLHPGFEVGVLSDPMDISTFVPVETVYHTAEANVWEVFEVSLANYTGDGAYIGIRTADNPNSNTQYTYTYPYLDNFILEMIPTCPRPDSLMASNATTTTVDLSWHERGSANQWQIEYGPLGFTPGTGTVVIANSNPFTLTNLPVAYQGEYYVRSICGAGDTGDYSRVPCAFAATQIPATIPYDYNFESEAEWLNWQTSTNTSTNWFRGTAANTNGNNSQYSMYVSADQGATYRPYSNNAVVNTAVYRDIDFGTTQNSFTLSFDARVGGSVAASYDGLMVFLVDPAIAPVASNNNITSPWGNVNNLYRIATVRLDTAWHTYTASFDTISGVKRVAFFWFNQNTTSYEAWPEPAAVDNIHIDVSDCARPVATTVTAVGSTSASLSWYGPASANYEVIYRKYPGNYANNFAYTNTNSIMLTGLDPMTEYAVWVRKLCTGGDTSLTSDGITFATSLCDNSVIASTGAATGTSYYTPVDNFYRYTLTETIIDSAELVGSTFISAIAYNYNYSSAMTDKTDVAIYLQHTNKSVFSSSSDMEVLDSTAVKVYEGSLNCSSGWNYFTFDTLFEWDGHSNLMVIVDDNSYAYDGSSYVFNTSSCSGYKTLVWYSDSYDADPTSSSYSGSKTYFQYRATMQLISCGGDACSVPGALNATNVSYNGATLNWTGSATDYEVSVKAVNDAVWPVETPVTGNSYDVSNLAPATTYQFRVRAICDADEELISDWGIGTFVTDSLPCFAPSALTLEDAGMNTATFSWTVNGEENGWNIHVWNTAFDQSYDVTANPATVTGLTKNTTYYAAVQAICGNGAAESEFSDTISFTTADCPIPTGVAVNNVTTNAATVTWSGTAASYVLEYGPVGFPEGEGTMVNNITGTSYTLTGLNSSYSYDVYVMANCDGQNSSNWSEPVTFTTQVGIDGVDGVNVTLYPNPASQSTTVTLSGVSGEVTITIVDMNGRTVRTEQMSCEGDCVKTMEVTGLAQGAYFVRVNGDNVNMVKKLVVK